MSIARIIWAVSLLIAIVLAFIDTGQDAAIIAVLGLVSGWFVAHEHRAGLILAALFLISGGAGALAGIPELGKYLTSILTAIGALMAAASVMAILRRVFERLAGKSDA